MEAPIGARSIDFVVCHAGELWFCEVKTASTVRGCLREAIGQLLEYALWRGATRLPRFFVGGEPGLDDSSKAYLAALNQSFPIPIKYQYLRLD